MNENCRKITYVSNVGRRGADRHHLLIAWLITISSGVAKDLDASEFVKMHCMGLAGGVKCLTDLRGGCREVVLLALRHSVGSFADC